MDLRHLRYFIATAEELHFTRAAARLHIGQPPLSQQIRDLEREIGTPLFLRQARRVELTEAGASFLADARSIIDLVERSKLSAQQYARGERGSIRVGFTSSASFNPFVPDVISKYRAARPNVQIALIESGSSFLLKDLLDRRLDIAFLRPPGGEVTQLRVEFLLEESLMVALPKAHGLAARSSVPLVSLASEPFIMYPRQNGLALYDTIIAACHNAGFSPRIAQEAPQMSSTVNLVAAGLGITIVPESMRQLHPYGVIFKPLKGVTARAVLSLACAAGPVSAAVADFMTLVSREASQRRGFRRSPRPKL